MVRHRLSRPSIQKYNVIDFFFGIFLLLFTSINMLNLRLLILNSYSWCKTKRYYKVIFIHSLFVFWRMNSISAYILYFLVLEKWHMKTVTHISISL